MDLDLVPSETGWVVSPTIRLVINKITTNIENNFIKKAGIEDDMKKMQEALTEILSAMVTLEKNCFVDNRELCMVRKIKDAIYDAEDIMDEIEYHLLEEKSRKQQKTISSVAPSFRFSYQFMVGNRRFKSKVQAVAESLVVARSGAIVINPVQIETNIYENLNAHEHEKLRDISNKMIGRDEECRHLLRFLLMESESSHQIMAIVGEGGVGKTALVQMVYNDSSLNDHFDSKIWLALTNDSDERDMLSLTKEMLKCVCQNFSTVDVSLDMLQKKLEIELPSKKVFVVLDEPRSVRQSSKVLTLLERAKQGSKIILTTQFHSIVNQLRGVTLHFQSRWLHRLSKEDGWLLFELLAFNSDNTHKYKELVSIGKDIVKHLPGLPLAIKNLGLHLRGNSDIEKWNTILNQAKEFSAVSKPFGHCGRYQGGPWVESMGAIHVRYKYLSRYLKRCFAFCGLFPKGSSLKPDQLVHMWIAHGFVFPQKGKSLQEIGRDYFNELLGWAFIQRTTQGHKVSYVLHDQMHDLANYVSQDHVFVLNEGSIEGHNEKSYSIRHLCVYPGAIERLTDFQGLDKLRTLIVLDGKVNPSGQIKKKTKVHPSGNLEGLFNELKSIRVLDIRCPSIRLTNDIGQCIHLRYLSIPNWDEPLPNSISKLHHLQVLHSI